LSLANYPLKTNHIMVAIKTQLRFHTNSNFILHLPGRKLQLNNRPKRKLICSIKERAEIIADISLAAPTLYLKDTFIVVLLRPFYLFTLFF